MKQFKQFTEAVTADANEAGFPTVTTWDRGEEGPPMFTAHLTLDGHEYLLVLAPTDQSAAWP